MLTGRAIVHANVYRKQNRTVQFEIDGHTLGGAIALCGLLATITGGAGQEIRHLANLTNRFIDGGQSFRVSFPNRIETSLYGSLVSPTNVNCAVSA
jgi:hypothetical protein